MCNGYKDREYLEKAILARRLGKNCIIVLEQVEEVSEVIAASRRLGIRPVLGVRAKPSTKGEGRWGISAGDRAKFGLTVPEIVEAVEMLREADLLSDFSCCTFTSAPKFRPSKFSKTLSARPGAFLWNWPNWAQTLVVSRRGRRSGRRLRRLQVELLCQQKLQYSKLRQRCGGGNQGLLRCGRSGGAHADQRKWSSAGLASILCWCSTFSRSARCPVPRPDRWAPTDPVLLRNLNEAYQALTPDNFQETYNDVTHFKEQAVSTFNLEMSQPCAIGPARSRSTGPPVGRSATT